MTTPDQMRLMTDCVKAAEALEFRLEAGDSRISIRTDEGSVVYFMSSVEELHGWLLGYATAMGEECYNKIAMAVAR